MVNYFPQLKGVCLNCQIGEMIKNTLHADDSVKNTSLVTPKKYIY